MWFAVAFLLGSPKKKGIPAETSGGDCENKPDGSPPTPQAGIQSVAEGFVVAYKSNQKESADLQRKANSIQMRIAWIAAFSLFAAFVAAFFSFRNLLEVERQVRLTQESIVSNGRAYVNAGTPRFGDHFAVIWSNVGNTQIREGRYTLNFAISGDGNVSFMDNDGGREHRIFIGPHNTGDSLTDQPITRDQMRSPVGPNIRCTCGDG